MKPPFAHLRRPILLIAAIAAASPALADVKDGVDAWAKGDYKGAVAQWKGPAQKGDADAQFNLGQAYKLGRGVGANLKTAEDWYRKAATQDHVQAQANLGLIMFQRGDRAGAMPWLKKAADAGEPRAQYVYGTALFNGDLVQKDWVRAYAMMTRAAGSGLPQAATSLSQMNGFTPPDQRAQGVALARQWEGGVTAAPVAAPAPAPAPVETATRTPEPSPAPVARPAAPAVSPAGWRVQLGAYGNAAAAQKAWGTIRGKVAGLGSVQPMIVDAGTVTRLQAGPFASRAAASQICSAAQAAGQACFPVAP